MKKRNRLLALLLALTLSISNVPSLPAKAAETTQQEENMEFLALINKDRLKENLPPYIVTDAMMEAAQIRVKELETKCSNTRPNSKGKWYTVFEDIGIIHDLTKLTDAPPNRLYNVSEFKASHSKTVAELYKQFMADNDIKNALLVKKDSNIRTHLGLGHTTGSITINGKKDSNPWSLLLIGKYVPEAVMMKNPDTIITVPKGLSIDDMGLVLQVQSRSPEGYICTGELPIISEMCTGYNSEETGTQKVTVNYRYSSTSTLSTSFMVNVEKSSPKTPESFSATGTSYNTVTIKWAPAENATSYKIYRSTKKSSGYSSIKTLKVKDLNLNDDGLYTYKDTDRTSGKMYYYKIKAFSGSTDSNYTSWDEAKPNIDAPASVKVKKKSRTSVHVSWKKVNHATSYRVYYATSKNGHYKRAGITKKNSFTIKRLSKKRKTYYIKVLSYRKDLPGRYSKIITKKMR